MDRVSTPVTMVLMSLSVSVREARAGSRPRKTVGFPVKTSSPSKKLSTVVLLSWTFFLTPPRAQLGRLLPPSSPRAKLCTSHTVSPLYTKISPMLSLLKTSTSFYARQKVLDALSALSSRRDVVSTLQLLSSRMLLERLLRRPLPLVSVLAPVTCMRPPSRRKSTPISTVNVVYLWVVSVSYIVHIVTFEPI